MKKIVVILILLSFFCSCGSVVCSARNDYKEGKNHDDSSNVTSYFDVNCTVYGSADSVIEQYYHLIPFGTSFFTRFLNYFPGRVNGNLALSVDCIDFIHGDFYFTSHGKTQGWFGGHFSGWIMMVGFVGHVYEGLSRQMDPYKGFAGFARSVRAVGHTFN